jgi:hypothetical protein
MARKGFERQGPLPTVAHYKGHELRQLLVICRSDRIPGYLQPHGKAFTGGAAGRRPVRARASAAVSLLQVRRRKG